MSQQSQSLYRIEGAAAYLGVHPRTVTRLIAEGELGWVRIGERGVRVSQQNLDDYVTERTQPATARPGRRVAV